MIADTLNNTIDKSRQKAVLHTLQYYSLFHYPLTAEEILSNMAVATQLNLLKETLDHLQMTGIVFDHDGYYSLEENVEDLVYKRKQANSLAARKISRAIGVGKFIYLFPFVRFIGISGSLSKGYADNKSDFDFFIVTETNRLWICRTLLHLFKKLTFLAGQQHKFCMNYFVDLQKLEIEEKNCYTAIELASLIPVSGAEVYDQLQRDNDWIKKFLPNEYIGFSKKNDSAANSKNMLKRSLESCIDLLGPAKLNATFMKMTDTKWRKKWARKNYPMQDYDLAFKTTLHISKNHSANHQKRVLTALSKLNSEQ